MVFEKEKKNKYADRNPQRCYAIASIFAAQVI